MRAEQRPAAVRRTGSALILPLILLIGGLAARAALAQSTPGAGPPVPPTRPSVGALGANSAPAAPTQIAATQIAPTTRDAAAQPTPQVQALLGNLSSDDYATRKKAEDQLVDMGDDVVPQLRAAQAQKLSDEAAARVVEAIDRIHENDMTGPSIITLHYHNAPLMQVLLDFARQARADMGIHRRNIQDYAAGRTITIDVDHVSFWKALSAIMDATELRVVPYSPSGFTLEVMGGMGNMFAFGNQIATHGAVAVIPQSCQRTRMIDFRTGAKQDFFSLQLAALIEPKMHVLGATSFGWLKDCVDDRGNELAPVTQRGPPGISMRPMWFWPLQTMLTDAPNLGSKIVRLRGELVLTVQSGSKVIDVDDLSKLHDMEVDVRGAAVVLQSFAPADNNEYRLNISITGPQAQNQFQWQAIFSPDVNLQIRDASDNPVQFRRVQNSFSSPGVMKESIYFSKAGGPGAAAGPYRLHWEVPTETRRITVPFELHDLPLPN